MSGDFSIHGSSFEDFDLNLEKIKSEVFKSKSFDISPLKLLSPESLEKALAEWRTEQLQKVEEELNLLHTIEDMMKHFDGQHFEGYTDEKKFAEIIKQIRSVPNQNKN